MTGFKSLIVAIPLTIGALGFVAASGTLDGDPPGGEPGGTDPLAATLTTAAAAGATPDGVLVAGLTPEEAGTLVAWLAQSSAEKAELMAALTAASDANSALAAAESSLRGSPSDAGLQAQLVSARALAESAGLRLGAAQESVAAVVDELIERPVSAAMKTAARVASRGLPPEFAAANLAEAQLQALQIAVKAERRAARMNRSLGTSHAQALADIRANGAVIAAKQRLVSHGEAIQAVFAAAGLQ